jgi:Zn-dependent protease with chaperone function
VPAQSLPAATPRAPAVRESRDVRSYTLPPEEHRRAVAYSRARYRLHFAAFGWEVLVLSALIAVRVAPRFRDLAERVSRRSFVQTLVFVPLFFTVEQLLYLPVCLWGHRLSLAYGQSIQGWGSWLWDAVKGHLVVLCLLVPVVGILYALLRRTPRTWWFWFWLASVPIIVFVVFIAPFVIDPLFFEFEPLASRAPELVEPIETVTARGGLSIPRDRMFLMDASRKVTSLNAYVTGIGASRRVVVWDTTRQRMTTAQTLFVFGHEMGHYVLAHIPKTIVFVSALLFAASWLGHLLLRGLFGRGGDRWGIRGLADRASLPVLMLVLVVFGEIATPAIASYSRRIEHDADVYGLEVIHGVVPDSRKAAAQAFQVLGEVNLSDPSPSPFIEFWLYDHPSIGDRVAFARGYDPWSKGERPRYVRDTGP